MPIDEAVEFSAVCRIFYVDQNIARRRSRLCHLGQSSTTLSGGEATGEVGCRIIETRYRKDLNILDEPTTGLHFEDVRVLLGVLQ